MKIEKYFFKKIKHRGETIIEVLVAILILTGVLIAAFSMLNKSIDANVNVKNRIIALNIAREGIEAVRNIRDTNWLKYSGDRRGKWLCWDSETTSNACSGAGADTLLNDDTFYTVDFSPDNHRYYLVDEGPDSELNLTTSQTDQSELRLYQFPSTSPFAGRYTHEKNDGGSLNYNASPFFRQIYLDIQNPFKKEVDEGGSFPTFCDNEVNHPDCTKHRARIISLVQWKEEGKTQSMTLESYIYDFYERDAY